MSSEPGQMTVLLLTAAIETHARMRNNLRTATDLRRADYLQGLRFYIEALPPEVRHIVFCENTGADLTEFQALSGLAAERGRALHFISFRGETPPEKGKGVCEFEILDRAHDWMAGRFPPQTVVWKLTGRLILKNVAGLIRSRPAGAGVYVNMRSVPLIGERLGGNDWAEMRVLSYTLAAYEDLMRARGPSFGYVTEKGLFQALHRAWLAQGPIVPRFRRQPRFKGICGGSNKDYESLEYQVKDAIRSLARVVAPGLWL